MTIRAIGTLTLLLLGFRSPLQAQAQKVHAELSMKPGGIAFTGTVPAPRLEVSDSSIIVTGYLFGGELVCMKHTLRSRATNNSIELTIVSQILPQYQTHGDTVNDCGVIFESLAFRITATGLRSGKYALKVFWKYGTSRKSLLGSWAPIPVPNASPRSRDPLKPLAIHGIRSVPYGVECGPHLPGMRKPPGRKIRDSGWTALSQDESPA